MTELVGTIDVENILGEGPVWDDRLGRLWWTDIHSRRLYRWDWDVREVGIIDLPRRLGSFCLTSEEGCLLCAFAIGFALVWPATGRNEWLHVIEPDSRGIRMNDGRIDRHGRFWAGSMVENADIAQADTGSLYRVTPDGAVAPQFDGIRISNSTCFSPDGSVMYFADTPTGRIDRFDVSADGTLGERRLFATVEGTGGPDGSDIAADGCLWNAEWGAGQLTRYRPDGSVIERVPVPVSRPTCPTFGGPQLDHIFVTTSRLELDADDLAREPDAGKVLILRSGSSRGIPAPRFSLDALGGVSGKADAA